MKGRLSGGCFIFFWFTKRMQLMSKLKCFVGISLHTRLLGHRFVIIMYKANHFTNKLVSGGIIKNWPDCQTHKTCWIEERTEIFCNNNSQNFENKNQKSNETSDCEFYEKILLIPTQKLYNQNTYIFLVNLLRYVTRRNLILQIFWFPWEPLKKWISLILKLTASNRWKFLA